MIGSGSGDSGVFLAGTFDGLLAFDLEILRELGIGVGSPTLEDRRSLRVFRGGGDSVEACRAPSFSPASGVFKDDTALSSGGSPLKIPSDSGVKRFPALRAALIARCVGGFEGPARSSSSPEWVSICWNRAFPFPPGVGLGVTFEDRFARLSAWIGVSTSAGSAPVESFLSSASSSLRRFRVIGVLPSFFREFVGVGVLKNIVMGSCLLRDLVDIERATRAGGY